MKYPFMRTETVDLNTWSKVNHDLKKMMEAAVSGEYTQAELADFCRQAVRDGKALPKDTGMVFWGFDDPETMPSDARCEFFYLPTYLMVLTMISGINRYPELMQIEGVNDILSRGLCACTGRGLSGSGYDSYANLMENLKMFIEAGVPLFLRNHPGICDGFCEMFDDLIEHIRNDYNRGEHVFDWNRDFSTDQRELLELYDRSLPLGREKRVWYVAYGSNLLKDRLKSYIVGGKCAYNQRDYPPCSDTRMPERSVPVTIPYSMYYSNYGMGSWKNSAVCFLDTSKPGLAYGRAYLLREDQLKWIHSREGKGPDWYPQCVRLDDIDGIPAYTFSNPEEKEHQPFSKVSAIYGIILFRGMKETYPNMMDDAILDYLISCN